MCYKLEADTSQTGRSPKYTNYICLVLAKQPLLSFKSMFLFPLFLGKARPSVHGHFIWGHVQDDAERSSPACPLQKQGYLDHALGAVMLLSYAYTMLGNSLLPWSKNKRKIQQKNHPSKFASVCGMGDVGTQTR